VSQNAGEYCTALVHGHSPALVVSALARAIPAALRGAGADKNS